MKSPALFLVLSLVTACSTHTETPVDVDGRLALEVGRGLVEACPAGADPGDEGARNACAQRLEFPALRASMHDPFIWGGQPAEGSYSLEHGLNKFNKRAWRRMYLSTFMFGSGYTFERTGDITVLHVPVTFRGAMPPGAYPYPFWHSDKKWNAYNYATTLHFVIKHGEVLGALRSKAQDTARPKVPRQWNGIWRWTEGDREMPYVALYDYLLSPANPFKQRLEVAYRTLEAGMRQHRCDACHAPDNAGHSELLELLIYPNQALVARHDIIAQLADDIMPPDNALGIPSGIADHDARDRLMDLARTFADVGDQALAWEGQ